ncbi:MAG: hypothetical protein ACE1ZA_07280 [Pseudomonadales bacterium]
MQKSQLLPVVECSGCGRELPGAPHNVMSAIAYCGRRWLIKEMIVIVSSGYMADQL